MKIDPLILARLYLFVREVGGQNRGVWVGSIQAITETPHQSWCASFVSLILGLAFFGQSPLPRTASCDVLLEHARAQGWLTHTPTVGDVFLLLNSPTDAHHTGFVSSVDPLVGIAGNTSADGQSSNGDRVAEHALDVSPDAIIYIHYPR